MLITISGVLDEAALSEARDFAATLAWRDGAETAGSVAKAVKRNSQADLSSRTGAKLRDRLKAAISAHPVLRAAAQPKRFSALLVSRTETGGGYGLHVDNAFMGDGADRIRTDVSFTLFLSDPDTYAGGELSIEHAGLTQALKPSAGDLVLYPSTSLHEVRPVTSGTRLACVGWIESHVRSSEDREILFDLENLRASLAQRHAPQSPEMLTLAKTISNLLRRLG
jgi:PKHD-type hydroxylase